MTLHISSPELERQVAALAHDAGREPDSVAVELLDAAVRRYNAKLAKLRAALEEGEKSGIDEDFSIESLIAELDAEPD
ncbi:MAG: type II toxin-antitoxin system ParD family antitoxin [Alphaproteobacteria bacterium]